MESAVNLCKFRGNPYVELVHWTNQLLQQPDSDWHRILPQAGINLSRLAADHTNFLDRLPRGATAISDFAPQLEEMVERGWVYASLLFNQYKIRSGHLLVALLKTPTLRSALFQISREFEKLRPDTVTAEFDALTSGSPEAKEATPAVTSLAADSGASELEISAGGGKALAKFATNLTAKAKAGELDPVLGRDEEIRQIIDILMRRRQNNPILTGEAGVGKTAIVEGFALKIAAGEVPPPLLSVQLWNLDLGLLQAGAGVRGEFENHLK
ncbi:MAG: type VI secretion system ATPase TssH, partial [Chthoniobacterales bacterium]|nr:type VI secretion system ATPase TssH [Chthoniobacterales bacterium]